MTMTTDTPTECKPDKLGMYSVEVLISLDKEEYEKLVKVAASVGTRMSCSTITARFMKMLGRYRICRLTMSV